MKLSRVLLLAVAVLPWTALRAHARRPIEERSVPDAQDFDPEYQEFYKLADKRKGKIDDIVKAALAKAPRSPQLDEIDDALLAIPLDGTHADQEISIWGGYGAGGHGDSNAADKAAAGAYSGARASGASHGAALAAAGAAVSASAYGAIAANTHDDYGDAVRGVRNVRATTLGFYLNYKLGRWLDAARWACFSSDWSPILSVLAARAMRQAYEMKGPAWSCAYKTMGTFAVDDYAKGIGSIAELPITDAQRLQVLREFRAHLDKVAVDPPNLSYGCAKYNEPNPTGNYYKSSTKVCETEPDRINLTGFTTAAGFLERHPALDPEGTKAWMHELAVKSKLCDPAYYHVPGNAVLDPACAKIGLPTQKAGTAASAASAAPASAAASAPAPKEPEPTGPPISVEWEGKWWDAVELSRQDGKVCIHYVGWEKKWDECVPPARVRKR